MNVGIWLLEFEEQGIMQIIGLSLGIFRFGPSKQYVSRTMVIVRRMDGKEDVLKVFTYIVDADVPFLCGKRTMVERWNLKIDTKGIGDRDRWKKEGF